MSSTGAQFADIVASGPLLLGILAAAAAGFVSFASPCVVPLVPGYMSYLAGVVGGQQYRWRVAGAALMFITGFTVVFVLATATVFGAISALTLQAELLQRLGGVVTIVMGLALGWTPCLGPTLAAIISISAGTEGMTAVRGIVLIVAYCLGLGLPFLVVALGSARAMRGVGWLRKHSRAIQIAGGVALILVGIALVSGQWAHFITWVRQWTVDYGTTLI